MNAGKKGHHDDDEAVASLTPPAFWQESTSSAYIIDRPEEKDPIQDERPLLSVLNSVVDHVMVPPTPLEPDEFAHQSNSCLVPVLRIFGPVLRRDSGLCISPVQSACLYIHGAFPYLLARPVVAGPDGSLHRGSHRNDTHNHLGAAQVDWDSAESVERILSALEVSLEEAIQSSMQVHAPSGAAASNTGHQATRKVIRRITVVKGRGFYTYCPGPPAPFLRVEYTDPKLRWKVKLMLEQGLDVPRSYHPDPQQYQSTLTPPIMENDDTSNLSEALKFHCYEAHIPYTMQFFKDWNLAGMQYIHVSTAKFRRPVPKHKPARVLDQDVPKEALFLESNTPIWHLWETEQQELSSSGDAVPQSMDSQTGNPSLQQSYGEDTSSQESRRTQHQSETAIDPFWTRCETSCDLEMDISVEQILNVKSVMTDLPQDFEERKKVHWRAVPSLRELWRKERQRMSSLLPPKDDFLSCDQDPVNEQAATLTLNAKDAPVPGARLAAEGMHRLFRPSHGLEEQFRRAMKQIVNRHSKSVARVDAVLIGRHQEESKHIDPQCSPPWDTAVEALEALSNQFNGDEIDEKLGGNHRFFVAKSQSSHGSSHLSENNILSQACTQDPFEFSQRVERGDGAIDESLGHAEDLIDPMTLTPYEPFEDDNDQETEMSEHDFEKYLIATQRTICDTEDGESDEGTQERETTNTPISLMKGYSESEHMTNPGWRESVEELDDGSEGDIMVESWMERNESLEALSPSGRSESALTFDDTPSATLAAQSSRPLPSATAQMVGQELTAPTRFDVATGQGFNQCQSGPGLLLDKALETPPTWLAHSTAYSNLRRGLISECRILMKGVAVDYMCDSHLEPVITAPSRGKVDAWMRQKRKREADQPNQLPKACKPRKGLQAKTSAWACTAMAIDNNSLKLVGSKSNGRMKENGHSKIGATAAADVVQDIEEVEWDVSQRSILSTTQSPVDLILEPKTDNNASRSSDGPVRASRSALDAATRRLSTDPYDGLSNISSEQVMSDSTRRSGSQTESDALNGIGQQGGGIYVEGGGGLKAKDRRQLEAKDTIAGTSYLHGSDLSSPVSIMAIEVHVQCRTGRAGVNDSKEIAMRPNPEKDKISAIVYVIARDPGGGEPLEFLERGCLYIPSERGQDVFCSAKTMASSIPTKTLGISSKSEVETVRDEKHLLLRFASVTRRKDPDMLLSWDTQAAGLGYIIERCAAIEMSYSDQARTSSPSRRTVELDMVRLLGRTPLAKKADENVRDAPAKEAMRNPHPTVPDVAKPIESINGSKSELQWSGSGLGAEWDERVGAGAAAASVIGRLVFAGWKCVAEEVKHPNASYLPAMVSTVLNKRIPFHDDLLLTRWYSCDNGRERWRVLHHRLTQAVSCLMLFDALDIVGRAAEAASLSGVEFSQSFPGIRGSQYKVEGVLLRALQSINADERGAKRGANVGADHDSSLSSESKSQTQSPWKVRRRPDNPSDENYFFFSPSLQDTIRQEALECQALTLEPKSGCYDDPVVVCDFTALYPSLMIGYNLCYSTCAGKLDYHSTRREMRLEGRTTGRVGPMLYSEARTATVLKHHMKSLIDEGDEEGYPLSTRDRAYVSPTGTVFVSEGVLKGVLPQVLDEMLSTRAMLKKAAKLYKKHVPDVSPSVLRQLEARQLAIKMIANVIYGYTSATFSGRSAMPLVADSIVECGRRTLTNAIDLAKSWGRDKAGRWFGAEVIYGDTDSLFIRLKGRSVREAFEFGEAFCKKVTASNPPPVHLKLEKVYKGSIMQTKKKYAGMKFESRDQKKATFEAKGIETIRRDQCALTQKILRNALVTLFRSGIDAAKSYIFRQWCLILSGSLPVSDFILTGRVRSRYRGGRVGPVQAVLARRLAESDPGRIVRHKERIPYVIVATPGSTFRLRDCVLTPTELLEQWDAYTIHFEYYITKHVNAALQRCLGLPPYKIDVTTWYWSCPKPKRRIHFWPVTRACRSIMISSYFGSDTCALCGKKCRAQGRSKAVVCGDCQKDGVNAMHSALVRLNRTQNEAHAVAMRCSNCNACFEDSTTFAVEKGGKSGVLNSSVVSAMSQANHGILTPIANCTCIDCPRIFERHRLREAELEAVEICKSLDLF